MMILIAIIIALLVISASIYGITQALDSEAEFDDGNIDELCGHDWNPQPDNTKPQEPNDT